MKSLYPEGNDCPWWERNPDVAGPFGKRSSSIYTNWCKGGGVATLKNLKNAGLVDKAHEPGAWANRLIEAKEFERDLETATGIAADLVFGRDEL